MHLAIAPDGDIALFTGCSLISASTTRTAPTSQRTTGLGKALLPPPLDLAGVAAPQASARTAWPLHSLFAATANGDRLQQGQNHHPVPTGQRHHQLPPRGHRQPAAFRASRAPWAAVRSAAWPTCWPPLSQNQNTAPRTALWCAPPCQKPACKRSRCSRRSPTGASRRCGSRHQRSFVRMPMPVEAASRPAVRRGVGRAGQTDTIRHAMSGCPPQPGRGRHRLNSERASRASAFPTCGKLGPTGGLSRWQADGFAEAFSMRAIRSLCQHAAVGFENDGAGFR